MNVGLLFPGCDRPRQSLLAAVAGGFLGGMAGLALGLGVLATATLAGLLAGVGDLCAHLLVRDPQFEAAIGSIRNRI